MLCYAHSSFLPTTMYDNCFAAMYPIQKIHNKGREQDKMMLFLKKIISLKFFCFARTTFLSIFKHPSYLQGMWQRDVIFFRERGSMK